MVDMVALNRLEKELKYTIEIVNKLLPFRILAEFSGHNER